MILSRTEQLLLARRKLVDVSVYLIHAAVLAQQLGRAHRPHALHSRNIVGGIAAQRKHVDDLRRAVYPPLFTDGRLVQHLIVGTRLAGPVLEHVRRHQLAVILVRRHHIHVEALGGAAARHGTYHVVGLEAAYHQHRDIQGLDYRRERFKSVDDQLRGLGSVGLVLGVHLVAKRSSRRVETHCDVSGLLPVDQLQQVFGKSEQDGRVNSLGVHHGAPKESIIHLEDKRVAVDQKKFHIETQICDNF